MIFLDNFHQSRSLTVHNAGCFICFSAKNNLTPTWFEHAAFWSGVRRATIAPRSPSYRKWSNCWKQCVHTGTSKNDARNLSWSREIVNLCISSFLWDNLIKQSKQVMMLKKLKYVGKFLCILKKNNQKTWMGLIRNLEYILM